MPYSYSDFKEEIRNHFLNNIDRSSRILDVGPGSGTYASLLPEFKMDALEIFEPYAQMFKLSEKYENLFFGDIRNFDIDQYDYIILGDVLEHLSIDDAKTILKKAGNRKILVAVPYLFEQGEEFGNVYETHLQADLTEDLMIERYALKVIYSNDRYGYFVNYEI